MLEPNDKIKMELSNDEATLIYLIRENQGEYVDFRIEMRGKRITRVCPETSYLVAGQKKHTYFKETNMV